MSYFIIDKYDNMSYNSIIFYVKEIIIMKKTLSIFLAVLMVITALPLTAITSFAAKSGDFEYEVISKEDKTCDCKKEV